MLFGSLAKPGHPMGKFCWGELVNTTTGTQYTQGLLGVCSAIVNRSAETDAKFPVCLISRLFVYKFPTVFYNLLNCDNTRKRADTEARAKEEEDQCL